MTPEQHNKYLAWSHIAFGSFFILMMVMFLALFGFVVFTSGGLGPGGPPTSVLLFLWIFMALFYGAMTIPSFVAGFGLLKGKRWAKTAAIIAGVVSAMSFPMGTAVCVYTFWFLFSEPGKLMFDHPRSELPPRRQSWAQEKMNQKPQVEYAPPPTPPDWR